MLLPTPAGPSMAHHDAAESQGSAGATGFRSPSAGRRGSRRPSPTCAPPPVHGERRARRAAGWTRPCGAGRVGRSCRTPSDAPTARARGVRLRARTGRSARAGRSMPEERSESPAGRRLAGAAWSPSPRPFGRLAQHRELAIGELAQRPDRRARCRAADRSRPGAASAPDGAMRKNISRTCRVRPSESSTANQVLPPSSSRLPVLFIQVIRQGAVRLPSSTMPLRRRSSSRLLGRPLDLHLVGLVAAVARMRDALRELAVVGEQQEPLGLVVETADRDQGLAPVLRHELHDRRAGRLRPRPRSGSRAAC